MKVMGKKIKKKHISESSIGGGGIGIAFVRDYPYLSVCFR
jgi:hypothetical protein